VIVRLLIAVLWTAAVLIGLGWPAGDFPSFELEYADKVVHFALFFVFGFLWMLALPLRADTRTWVVLLTGILFAIATEVYQGILPTNRSPDSWDVVADVFGLCIGIMLYHILALRRARMRRSRQRATHDRTVARRGATQHGRKRHEYR
jgi:glycopeptide antibiotics resistance protein